MTSAQKKERRAVRRKLQASVLDNHFSLSVRMTSTPAQLRAYSRVVTDKLLSGHNPLLVQVIQ